MGTYNNIGFSFRQFTNDTFLLPGIFKSRKIFN